MEIERVRPAPEGMAISTARGATPIRFGPFLWISLYIVTGWIAGAHADELPVDVFFQRPAFTSMLLSPDGGYLAAVVRLNGRNNLEIIDLQTRQAQALTSFEDADVLRVLWVNDTRLLLALGDAEEQSGKPTYSAWFAVDRDGSRLRRQGLITAYLGPAPEGGDRILVAARGRSVLFSDIYDVDTASLHQNLLSFDHPSNVYGWVVDHTGTPRIADAYLKGKHTLWYRDAPDLPWSQIAEGTEFRLPFHPLAFDADNKTLYVASDPRRDKMAVYTYDFGKKKLGELVAGSPQVEISSLISNRADGAVLGVRFQGDRPGVVWFDAEMARLQKAVDQALPDTYNVLQVPNAKVHRAVVFAYSDVNPGTYYLLDTDNLRLEDLAKARPWLDPKQMAERKPVHYTARDGLDILAYLTLPHGSSDKKPPLVVNIHGGPWVRGFVWGFNTEAQFFASRGYAVLEPEFRGSAGLGWKLFSSGFKQWGLAMQDDITDGVEWLIKEGIVDKNRICLYGASYGGYAALWGLIKTPDLYKCGVGYVAVTDVNLLFNARWSDLGRTDFWDYSAKTLIGDPDKDAEKFASVSPLANAEKLTVPVLLAYGGKDPRVPIEHGDAFRAALDKYKKTYEWVFFREEGHGYNKDEHRFEYYGRVDVFLNKYLQ